MSRPVLNAAAVALDVLCIGHAAYDMGFLVDGYPVENSKHETRDSTESGGGPAANAACLLSQWGMSCAFAGLVGDDVQGRRIRDEFIGLGTNVSLLELRPGHATPLSLILINKQNGSRTVVNRKISGASLTLDETALQAFQPRMLLLDGHELQASLLALSMFPDAVSILDAGSWREGTAELAGRVDFLAASERFASQATGLAALDTEPGRRACLGLLRARYRGTAIVTMGENGLIYDEGGGFRYLPAFNVQAVDTTAAGDIFHGAMAHAIARSLSLPEALRFASAAAALSVQVPGGRASIPALSAVAALAGGPPQG